jgi:hypothetical protein
MEELGLLQTARGRAAAAAGRQRRARGRVAQRVGGEEGRPAAWVTIGERGPA